MIAEILEELSEQEREKLYRGFNQEFEVIVRLENDRFIAVNLYSSEDLEISEESGSFTYGRT